MYYIQNELYFPAVDQANYEGVLAIGGDLSVARLLLAYRSGIFPWFNPDEPILWWAPPERMVLFFEDLRITKSMRNILNRSTFKVTFNTAFEEVIAQCQQISRPGQGSTWITDDMKSSYIQLHQLGFAKSVEVWQNGALVGGLYGVDLGHVFCGESMFSHVSNASKVAFIYLAQKLQAENYRIIDCQVYNDHLDRLGCIEISREDFMYILHTNITWAD